MNRSKHNRLIRKGSSEQLLVEALIKIARANVPAKARTYVILKPCSVTEK